MRVDSEAGMAYTDGTMHGWLVESERCRIDRIGNSRRIPLMVGYKAFSHRLPGTVSSRFSG